MLSNQEQLAAALLSPSILEAVPDAVAAVNQQGIIVQVNSQTEAMFGYTRDELIGQSIEILIPERHRKQPSHAGVQAMVGAESEQRDELATSHGKQ